MRILFCLIFLVHAIAYCGDFTPVFKNFGVNEGLPSSQVYQIIQDSKGYIWFGTDGGLVKFNGYEFKIYSVQDGLSTNVVFEVSEDPFGRIWCYGKDRKFHFFDNNRFNPFWFNDELTKYISTESSLFSFNVGPNSFEFSSSERSKNSVVYLKKTNGKEIAIKNANGIYIQDDENLSISVKCTDSMVNLFYNGDRIGYSNNWLTESYFACVKKVKDDIYFSIGRKLFKYNPIVRYAPTNIYNFPDEILALEADKNGNLFLGIRTSGLWRITNGDSSTLHCLIPNQSISSVMVDKDDGIWAASLYNGLYYCSDPSNQKINLPIEKNLKRLISDDKTIFALDLTDQLIEIGQKDQKYIVDSTLISANLKDHINACERKENSSELLWKIGIYYDTLSKFYFYLKNPNINTISDKENLYNVYRSSVQKLNSFRKTNSAIKFDFFINCVIPFQDSLFLLGSDIGVLTLNKQIFYDSLPKTVSVSNVNINRYQPTLPFARNKMRDIINLGDTMLIFGSAEKGLLIQKKGKRELFLTIKDGLISNVIDGLYIKDEYLVVQTKFGISVLSFSEGIVNYTNKNGLLSNHVWDVMIYDDHLWVATDKGTSVLDLKKKEYPDFPIKLIDFKVNSMSKSLSNHFELNYDESLLEFSFEGLSLHQLGDIKYRYYFKGEDVFWLESKNTTVRYSNLKNGEFEFWIQAQKSDQNWTSPICLFTINKYPPFWETIWFLLLMIGFLIFLFWLAFNLRYKRLKAREKMKFRLLDLERKTLQAQMNPHFIFNSLTSLQNLIIQNNPDKANEYLGKFARLTRLALVQSTQNYILIKEEISLLEYYVQLEQLRFPDYFTFEVQLELRDSNIYVPPFLIQPFIENAIRHGLTNVKCENGSLILKIENRDESTLQLIIVDNGSGREKNNKNTSHTSLGIRLITERLKLLLKIDAIIIEDLTNDGKQIGTKISVIIPYKSELNESTNN